MNRRNLIKGLAAFVAISILPSLPFPDKTIKKCNHYIGLGGAGSNIVDYILKNKNPQNSKFTCIDRERRADLSPQIKQLLFSIEENTKHQLLTPEIRDVFTKENRYILIGGLGGITGTYLLNSLNHLLYEQNHNFLSVCNTPFRFEGSRRKLYSEPIIQQFKNRTNFLYFSSEMIREKYGHLSIRQAFEKLDNHHYELAKKYLQENA